MPLQAIFPSISRSATFTARTSVVLFSLSILLSGSARGDEPLAKLRAAVVELGRRDASAEDRQKAADAITKLASSVPVRSYALVRAQQDPKEGVRINAIRTLSEFGPTAAQLWLDELVKLHKPHTDRSTAVRSEFIWLLVQMGKARPELVMPVLWQLLWEDDCLEVRLQAAGGLTRILLGLDPSPMRRPIQNLERGHPVEKVTAWVPVLHEAAKVLNASLNDPHEQVRLKVLKARNAVGSVGSPPPARELLNTLREKNPAIRVEALSALGGVASQRPRLVVPALVGALRDENKEVRVRAIWVLAGVRPTERSAVAALIEALKENDVQDNVGLSVCRSAAWALARMGPTAAREAIPAIVGWLDSTDVRLQADAIQLLRAVGSADERVAPTLRKVLTHKHRGARVYAAASLSKLGSTYHKETLPILLDGFDIRDVKDQSMGSEVDGRLGLIARTLGDMGPYAEEAVPKLRAILNDPKRQVIHNEVKEALDKIRP